MGTLSPPFLWPGVSRLRVSVTNCTGTESLLGSSGMTKFIERPCRSEGVAMAPLLLNASYLALAFMFYFKANYWARDILCFLVYLSAVVEFAPLVCWLLYFYVFSILNVASSSRIYRLRRYLLWEASTGIGIFGVDYDDDGFDFGDLLLIFLLSLRSSNSFKSLFTLP